MLTLKNAKASSAADNILNEYIKPTKHVMLLLYVELFNSVFDTGVLPSSWLECIVVPDLNYYRSVTLLMFTSILNLDYVSFRR